MKTLALFLITVFVFSNIAYSQNRESGFQNGNFLDKFSLKGGLDFSSVYNQNQSKFNEIGYNAFWVSIAYDYSKHFQFEFMYKNLGNYHYNYIQYVNNIYPDFYNYAKFDEYYPNEFRFKTNYFLNKVKRLNPIYLTGSFIFDFEHVKNSELSFSSIYDSSTHFWNQTFSHNVLSTYNRILLGFDIGFGLYLDLGHINFQTEFSFSAKVAPFVNRGYKGYAFNLSFAPVYKF